MSIKVLEIGQPIMTVKYIENEKDVELDSLGILINTSWDAKKDIMVDTIPMKPMRSSIVGNIVLPEVDSAVLIEDYYSFADDPNVFEEVIKTWPNMYDLNHLDRFKGVPHYLAPGDGDVTPKMNISLHAVSGGEDVGLHTTHARGDVDEFHCLVIGTAMLQIFHENDMSTLFENIYMAPGQVHDLIFAPDGVYPWHQYKSLTDSIFVGIQILRD